MPKKNWSSNLKKYLNYKWIILIGFLWAPLGNHAMSNAMGELSHPTPPPLLVVNDEPEGTLRPKRYRNLATLKEAPLNASISGQFSRESLNQIKGEFPENTWVVDVRQETHYFINGIPFSEYGFQNRENEQRTQHDILALEKFKTQEIPSGSIFEYHTIIEKNSGVIKTTTLSSIPVKEVHTSKQLVNALGLNYFRLTILDRHRPSDDQVENFLHFYQNLPSEHHLYFHCRGGRGRSTTMAIVYDILENGHTLSLEDIVNRHHQLGGAHILHYTQTPDKPWLSQARLERKRFLEQFYQFASQTKQRTSTSWRNWIENN